MRLFRSDTPVDVIIAGVLAGTLAPGKDVLAFAADKSGGAPERFAQCMRTAAALYPWAEVVDISGLPLNAVALSARSSSILERARCTIASAAILRERLAPALGLQASQTGLAPKIESAVDELYLTCYSHPDIQLMYKLFPDARKIYAPHSFDSLNASESRYYLPHCVDSRGWLTRLRDRAVDLLKQAAFGADSVLPRTYQVDEAYSFNRPMPWAGSQRDLRGCLNREAAQALFMRLPEPVRRHFESLARQCRQSSALLIGSTYHDWRTSRENERALLADVALAGKLVSAVRPGSLVIKPHPRNGEKDLVLLKARIEAALPGLPLVMMDSYHEYPIELVFSPFPIHACGSVLSSSMRALRRIYGTTSYCCEREALELYSMQPSLAEAAKAWVEDNRGDYIPI